jgi:nitrilase
MTETAVAIVQHPAAPGASLVVFPETWLTCYPAWVFGMAGWRGAIARKWHARLLRESPVLDHDGGTGDDIAPLRRAVRDAGVTVAI